MDIFFNLLKLKQIVLSDMSDMIVEFIENNS